MKDQPPKWRFRVLTKYHKNIHIAICTKRRKLCLYLRCRGEGGAAPFKKDDVILRQRPQAAWLPKDLVTRKLFFARRGAGEVVCTAPKN